jgi:hypothetical protein
MSPLSKLENFKQANRTGVPKRFRMILNIETLTAYP